MIRWNWKLNAALLADRSWYWLGIGRDLMVQTLIWIAYWLVVSTGYLLTRAPLAAGYVAVATMLVFVDLWFTNGVVSEWLWQWKHKLVSFVLGYYLCEWTRKYREIYNALLYSWWNARTITLYIFNR